MDGIIASFACRRINTAHPMILVTGGAASLAPTSCSTGLPTATSPWSTSTSSPTLATCTTSIACRATPPHLCAGRHWRHRLARTPAGRAPAPRHRQLRGRIACGPIHPRPRRLHPDQRRRHFQAFRGCKAILASAASYQKEAFRFLHVSTDEVYGTLSATDPAFSEDNRYEPNSPYSASKAASDHLVRAWHHTYGLPVLTTNCSNNYGPLHFPEKLIPS